jgi:hypothetical protein
MTKQKTPLHLTGLAAWLLVFLLAGAAAAEPRKPSVTGILDGKKELRINQIYLRPSTEAYEELKGVEFLADEDFANKAVYQTFHRRRMEGIELAVRKLSMPVKDFSNGRMHHRAGDIYVAGKIFEIFPDESIPILLERYRNGDATTKGNIVRASGRMAGKPAGDLLLEALEDKTYCDPVDPEVEGPPMRVCDLAYNQLVLRHRIRNVLRTIGPNDRIDNRDYHIAILKTKL